MSRHGWGGEVVLHLPADCEPAVNITGSADTSVPTVLEFTDVAPTAVRSRVRARLTLARQLSARPHRGCECAVGVLTPDLITLDASDSVLVVHPEAFAAAEADPLAVYEADLLVHLADAHADLVTGLTRLVQPAALDQAARVLPSAMDRNGITLRLERAQGHTDVRLPFPSRLDDASAAGEYVRAMATGTPSAVIACRLRSASGAVLGVLGDRARVTIRPSRAGQPGDRGSTACGNVSDGVQPDS